MQVLRRRNQRSDRQSHLNGTRTQDVRRGRPVPFFTGTPPTGGGLSPGRGVYDDPRSLHLGLAPQGLQQIPRKLSTSGDDRQTRARPPGTFIQGVLRTGKHSKRAQARRQRERSLSKDTQREREATQITGLEYPTTQANATSTGSEKTEKARMISRSLVVSARI
jgi:hypothetical protein